MESHPTGSIYGAIALVVALIILGALFVAAEIALISYVKARSNSWLAAASEVPRLLRSPQTRTVS